MSIVTLNDRAVRSVTAFGSLNTGSMVFIKKLTASSSGTLSFVDGTSDVVLDSTYKEYVFTFKNIHPSGDDVSFSFQGNAAGGADFNETITSTSFRARHTEDGSASALEYRTDGDQAQGTGEQLLPFSISGDTDHGFGGFLHLFNPSSTTFVKHFTSRFAVTIQGSSDKAGEYYVSGYFNTTSAIDEIRFKFSSGNIDAGDICLYGIL